MAGHRSAGQHAAAGRCVLLEVACALSGRVYAAAVLCQGSRPRLFSRSSVARAGRGECGPQRPLATLHCVSRLLLLIPTPRLASLHALCLTPSCRPPCVPRPSVWPCGCGRRRRRGSSWSRPSTRTRARRRCGGARVCVCVCVCARARVCILCVRVWMCPCGRERGRWCVVSVLRAANTHHGRLSLQHRWSCWKPVWLGGGGKGGRPAPPLLSGLCLLPGARWQAWASARTANARWSPPLLKSKTRTSNLQPLAVRAGEERSLHCAQL